jgi:transcriptional regulator with XRE-family HTH domain
MQANGMTRSDLAGRIALAPATLSNFLNGTNTSLGGLSVALACSIGIEIECDGRSIGPSSRNGHVRQDQPAVHQLLLEFDASFQLVTSEPTVRLILRKTPSIQTEPGRCSMTLMHSKVV